MTGAGDQAGAQGRCEYGNRPRDPARACSIRRPARGAEPWQPGARRARRDRPDSGHQRRPRPRARRALRRPPDFVEFDRAVDVAASAGSDVWDVCFLAVDPARAQAVSFTHPYIRIEGCYLVHADSAAREMGDISRLNLRSVPWKEAPTRSTLPVPQEPKGCYRFLPLPRRPPPSTHEISMAWRASVRQWKRRRACAPLLEFWSRHLWRSVTPWRFQSAGPWLTHIYPSFSPTELWMAL